MSLKRIGLVFRTELGQNIRRPLFWILLLIIVFITWGFSQGNVRLATGDSAVGGQKPWITSEFANAQMICLVSFLLYTFFVAVAAGMGIIHDDELKVGELLHVTSLRPSEYVWGKFLGVVFCFGAILGFHLLAMIFFNQVFPNAKADEIRGPFALMHYLRPFLFFALPALVFMAGISFAVGEWLRRPILVFVFPVMLFMACVFFFWGWQPTWLDPRIDRFIMMIDPAGFRWLSHTWLKVDRGVNFYNHASITFDTPFLLSRLALVVLGCAFVWLSQLHLARTLRGSGRSMSGLWARLLRRKPSLLTGKAIEIATELPQPLAILEMRAHPPGLLRGIFHVAIIELRELRSQPGLYIFVPWILLETIGLNLVAVGVFQTPLLLTPGTIAVGSMNTLTVLVCLLLLFYTVESMLREQHTRLASIHSATPVRSTAILFGKCLANSLVAIVIMIAAFIGCAIVLLVQGKVPINLRPFLLIWGVLLTVTFLAWTSFIAAILSITRNRYTTYALALGALIFSGYRQSTGKMNWVGNWDLWDAVRWSDMALFELDGTAILLNRLFVLSLTVFLTALAVRFFPRREFDGVRILDRIRPFALFKSSLRMLPYAIAPLALGIILYLQVDRGFQGEAEKKRQKDYWRHNIASWRDAPLPAITAVDVDLELEPSKRWFRIKGSFELKNHHTFALREFPLTGGDHWENVHWAMDGADYTPVDSSWLYIFTPAKPLAPQAKLRIGFSYEGRFPRGITKNGGGNMEFIVPSAVVLTSFSPSFVPVLGYLESVGVDDENRYESRIYPDNFYEGITESAFGSSTAFTTKVRVTAPEEFTINSIGTLEEETVADHRRTVVWKSDHPVRFFNVVAGKWAVHHGKGTSIYYHPQHAYNIAEMSEALDAARKYYSEWFYPYPWRELKLSEFPNLADYAQGFATDITFSESIGFLTKNEPKANAAFLVTAHESAHQWWGNIVTPGKGPGGNIVSEGMAHFSTILLFEQVKGLQQRIEFCKRIEESYNQARRKDSEKPLVKTDGSRPEDNTVTYDKGGWVFWMLLQHMGGENALKGIRAFIEQYRLNADHPVLQDFIASMRPFAPDATAYDAFTKQWFFEVTVPEYRLGDAHLTEVPGPSAGPQAWEVTVHVENAGTGKMPIDVASVHGERFTEDGKPSAEYQEARQRIVLGPGEAKDVTIRCSFKPDRVIVDPDALVLQLQRKLAIVRF
jgi:ABC-type transport system involved in multi-copper enzyme maturation permease subunit